MTLLFIAHLLVRDDFMLRPLYRMCSTRRWRKQSKVRARARVGARVRVTATMVFPLPVSVAVIVRMDVPSVSIYIVFAVAFMRKTFVHSLAVSFIQAMSCWQALDSDQCFAFPRIPNSCAVTQMMLITYKSFQTKCLRWNVYSILHRGEVSERARKCKKKEQGNGSLICFDCASGFGVICKHDIFAFLLVTSTENPNLENNLFNENIRRVWSF